MHFLRKLTLAGIVLGLVPIGLGVAALVTQHWINIKMTNPFTNTDISVRYGSFTCRGTRCSDISEFTIVQGLLIAGVGAILLGIIIALFLTIFIRKQWVPLLSQIFLFAGPTSIFIGLLFYAKYVFEDVGRDQTTTLYLEYSIILMIIACPLGFLAALYFAFAAGVHYRDQQHPQGHHSTSVTVINRSEQF